GGGEAGRAAELEHAGASVAGGATDAGLLDHLTGRRARARHPRRGLVTRLPRGQVALVPLVCGPGPAPVVDRVAVLVGRRGPLLVGVLLVLVVAVGLHGLAGRPSGLVLLILRRRHYWSDAQAGQRGHEVHAFHCGLLSLMPFVATEVPGRA